MPIEGFQAKSQQISSLKRAFSRNYLRRFCAVRFSLHCGGWVTIATFLLCYADLKVSAINR